MAMGTRPHGGKQPRSDPGYQSALRENISDDRQGAPAKELGVVRKHSSICLKRSRHIESLVKRGAFALVDAKEALGKAK
jgi:hypothetical protein